MSGIKGFETNNKGIKVDLSQYPIQGMIPAALDSGNPPAADAAALVLDIGASAQQLADQALIWLQVST